MKQFVLQSFIALLLISCSSKNKQSMNNSTIMEVTTFKIKSSINSKEFVKRDVQIENDFTNKQQGFIKRQSGVDENGEYAVVVFWKTMADANASMSKFMKDESVSDYASMIDGASMKMERFVMDKAFNADKSEFIEIMTFDLIEGTNLNKFSKINNKIETEVTSKRTGFIQRLTGFNEEGKQVVAIYWDNKNNSDEALKPFMTNELAGKFMSKMTESSIWMGRYQTL